MNYDVMKRKCVQSQSSQLWIFVIAIVLLANVQQSCLLKLAPSHQLANSTETIVKLADSESTKLPSVNAKTNSDATSLKSQRQSRRHVANATDPNEYNDSDPVVPTQRVPILKRISTNQHESLTLYCDVGIDIANSIWLKDGHIVDVFTKGTRGGEMGGHRFIKEDNGAVLINTVRLEDNGRWQCEAENAAGFAVAGNPIYLIVLDRPKAPYLLIDGRRLDPGNIFIPVKENGELSITCIAEGGNPKPTLIWQLQLSQNIDVESQENVNINLNLTTTDDKPDVTNMDDIWNEFKMADYELQSYNINSGAKSEASLPRVYRAHHNATIMCVVSHPTVPTPLNASLLLDVQYSPSFGISRIPGFGFPLREGIPVSLKCDVDSNPPSTPVWQKDDGETPVPQSGDGFLNFSAIRREHSGWYKCTSRHLLGRFSSIGYFLNIRYDAPEVTQEPEDADIGVGSRQVEVALGGDVQLQCPSGSLGCWAHVDALSGQPRGLGVSQSQPAASLSLRDVVYQDSGVYKCIGQPPSETNVGVANGKKRLEVLRTIEVQVKGVPLVYTPTPYVAAAEGQMVHLTVEFCANPAPSRTQWINNDLLYRPGKHYGNVIAHNITNMTNIHCQEAKLTIREARPSYNGDFYFLVKSANGLTEAVITFNVTAANSGAYVNGATAVTTLSVLGRLTLLTCLRSVAVKIYNICFNSF